MTDNNHAACDAAYFSGDLSEYQERLSKLMIDDSPAIFANYSRAHARCIIRTFFESASHSISVLAGDFGNDFYSQPDIRAALSVAVAKGARVRVVSLNVSEASMGEVLRLKSELDAIPERKGSFEVRFATVRPGAQVKHYMIVDDKRYRLEEVHSESENSPVHAEVCCNGPSKAAALNLSFNNVWSRLLPQ